MVLDTRAFAADALSPRRARFFVRHALSAFPDAVVHIAELLTSELVTNTLEHAGSTALVEVSTVDGGVRVAVADDSGQPPRRRPCSDDVELRGRGIMLLVALADDWGVIELHTGKTVWFALAVPTPVASPRGRLG